MNHPSPAPSFSRHLPPGRGSGSIKWRRLLAAAVLVIAGLAGQPAVAANGDPAAPPRPRVVPEDTPAVASGKPVKAMFLGDSMSFGGFGDHFDKLLRTDPHISKLHTWIACGVFPLSWTKVPPFAQVKTRCGFCTIEPTDDPLKPKRFADVHGTPKGHVPGSHLVPKIEDLMEAVNPEVLVFQNGNNFFSCFKDRSSIQEEYHRNYIRSLTIPFLKHLLTTPSNLRRIYWITPPDCGNTSPEVEDFVFNLIQECAGDFAVIIDSRKVTKYPYKVMDKDREHFWGNEASEWADKIYSQIAEDLEKRPVSADPLLTEACKTNPPAILKAPEKAEASHRKVVKVSAKLVACTDIPDPSAFPYGEFLVGYRYQIVKNRSGGYEGKEILVLHPSYVKKVVRDLSAFKIGNTYDLELVEIDDKSLWAAVNRKDTVGDIEMNPYIQVADEKLHPDYAKEK